MDEFEYKIINKQLMRSRRNNRCGWTIEANIFETVKAFLLWNYTPDLLPLFPPSIDWECYPQLHEWYMHLSKPNPPQKRTLKCTPEEYREWVQSLDLSKPFDKAACDAHFTDSAGAAKPIEVDAVEIEEQANDTK